MAKTEKHDRPTLKKKSDQPKSSDAPEESVGQKRKDRSDEATEHNDNDKKKHKLGDLKSKIVWVYGLKPSISESALRDCFGDCGKIERIDKADRHAYIEFDSKKSLKAALKKNGELLGDLKLRVEVARESTKHSETNTVFFAGFDKELDLAMVRAAIHDAFSKYGEIVGEIRLPLIHSKKALKKPKGIGYVQMASVEQAAKAVKRLSGKQVAGGTLRLDFSEELKAPEKTKSRRRREKKKEKKSNEKKDGNSNEKDEDNSNEKDEENEAS